MLKRYNRKVNLKPRFFVFIAILLFVLGATFWACNLGDNNTTNKGTSSEAENETPISLEILCVGDIMAHTPQIESAAVGDGTYDFSENYEYVTKYIQEADLALCNLEATFAGEPYTGYPVFSAPDSLANAIKNAGFDVAITANNHMMDKGIDGLLRTLEVCSQAGLKTTGTQTDSTQNYLITEVKDVPIGIISYTYETAGTNDARSVNGNPISSEARDYINSYNHGLLEEDFTEIETAVESAKADGAKIIICYFHWGDEYSRSASEAQRELATRVAELDVDIIFASHPHVLQEAEYIPEIGIPVFYSMGNFLSNQREETLSNRYTEQGMLAYVNLEYTEKDGVTESKLSVLPTWLDKYYNGTKNVYKVIPLDSEFESNSSLLTSGHLSRAQQAFLDCQELFGEETLR